MRVLLVILVLALSVQSQTPDDADLEWMLIPEASGPMTEYVNLSIQTYVAKISRGDNKVKLWVRFDFPNGAPMKLFPRYDVGSARMMATFDCEKQTAKLTKGHGFIYDLQGTFITKVKDKDAAKEVPASVGHAIFQYFCERGPVSNQPPKLKAKP